MLHLGYAHKSAYWNILSDNIITRQYNHLPIVGLLVYSLHKESIM